VGIEDGDAYLPIFLCERACVMARRGQHGDSAAYCGRRNAPNIETAIRQLINWLYEEAKISSRILGCDGMGLAEDEHPTSVVVVVVVIVSHEVPVL
jgi:hypothetical protein